MRRPVTKNNNITNDKIIALVLAAQEGDTKAAGEVVLRFMPMVRNMANRYSTGMDYEDQKQNAVLAIYHAIDKFNPYFGAKFAYYAGRWMTHYLQRYSKQEQEWVANLRSIEADVLVPSFEDQIIDNEEVNILHAYLSENIDKFSARDKELLELRIHQSCSLQEIADHFGVSKQRAHQLEYELLRSIRRELRIQNKRGKHA